MEDKEYSRPQDYPYQIVALESSECKCNASHEVGDALWGGVMHPDNIGGEYNPAEKVRELHSVELELIEEVGDE